jgi:Tfp pilus assembly protein PilN
MHEIDLLRGSGIPKRTTLGGIGAGVLGVLVPCLLVAGAVYKYTHDRTIVEILQRAVASEQAKIDNLSDAITQNKTLATDRDRIFAQLRKVSSRLKDYNQWSPVLEAIVRNMPESMVLMTIAVERSDIRRSVESEKNPGKKKVVAVPSRTLIVTLGGLPEHNCDDAVKALRSELKQSSVLGPKLEEIVVSQGTGYLNGIEIVSYKMRCIFKTRL